MSYTYTPDGIRNSKTVNGTKTEYLLNGTQILAQKTGSDVMWFFYDSTGARVGVQQGSITAYYLYNLQGDVVALADAATGKIIATYEYDAWGKCTVTNASGYTIGTANPFRYRGYYYDVETGFYYLNSRYYNPEVGRFLNADAFASTDISDVLSANMFAYCENNAVNCSDPMGHAGIGMMSGWDPQEFYKKKNNPKESVQNSNNSSNKATTVDITNRLNTAMVKNAVELSEINETFGGWAASIYFADKVKPGGDWDFKSQESWGLRPDVEYIYNGIALRYDDIGNIHYGHVGRILFEEQALLIAGGVVQIVSRTSKLSYYETYFDDPHDSEMISFGYHLWDVN